jgi:membrane protein involved in colicin uptake
VDVATAITELKVGEALVSLLLPDGSPAPVERTLIKPPASRVGPVTPDERKVLIDTDAVGAKYDTVVDRESAEELLAAKTQEAAAAVAASQAKDAADKAAAVEAKQGAQAAKEAERARIAAQRDADREAKAAAQAQAAAEREAANSPWSKALTSATRAASSSIGRQVANEIGKQVFGGGTRRSSASRGGLVGTVMRSVLGNLLRGR